MQGCDIVTKFGIFVTILSLLDKNRRHEIFPQQILIFKGGVRFLVASAVSAARRAPSLTLWYNAASLMSKGALRLGR